MIKLGDINTPNLPTNPLDGINSYFNSETGYMVFSGVANFTASYTFGWGVVNVNDTANASGLLVDNITVTPGSVPLPSTAWAGMALLGGLGILHMARRRKVVMA